MFWTAPALVTNRQEPAQVATANVSPNFFDLLSVRPLIGRIFPVGDSAIAGHEREVVISYALWQSWFGANARVVGRTLEVEGRVPLTIVGVMPRDFAFPRDVQIWKPELWTRANGRGEADRWRQAIGRLRPGISVDGARRELKSIEAQLGREFVSTNAGWTSDVRPFAESINGDVRGTLWALLTAVSLLLALVCVNVSTLVLQRERGRQQELATRVALGSSTTRLLLDSTAEYGMLAVMGLIVGILLAIVIHNGLLATASAEIAGLSRTRFDLRLVAYVAGIAAVCIVLTGTLPVLRNNRIDVATALRSGTTARVTGRSSRFLVAAELAVALILLGSAGLMVRTVLTLDHLDVGFDPSGVLATNLELPLSAVTPQGSNRPEWDRLVLFYSRVVQSVNAIPGITNAAVVATPSLAGVNATWLARTGIVPSEPDGSPEWRSVQSRAVTPDYFKVLRLPLRRGRAFSDQDAALNFLRSGTGQRTGVAIVNEAAARLFWPGLDPLGKAITIGNDSRVNGRIVVGVVGNARDIAPDRAAYPTIYVPFAESPAFGAMLLARQGPLKGSVSVSALHAQVRAANATLMIGPIQPLSLLYSDTIAPRRFVARVLTVFACFALLLSIVGLYGLMASSVSQRLPEFAIRAAMGATPQRVHAIVLREAMFVLLGGISAGAFGAWAAVQLLRTQLYDIQAMDPTAWIATITILATTAIAATWLPARRAAHSDPASMLRAN